MLARQAVAVVGVGTCWPWETAATLPSARRREALRRQRGEGRGHIVAAAHLQLVYDRSSLRHWQEQHVVQYGTYLSYDMSRTSGLSREQRGLGRPKLAQR